MMASPRQTSAQDPIGVGKKAKAAPLTRAGPAAYS
jgi:hypothetical protein